MVGGNHTVCNFFNVIFWICLCEVETLHKVAFEPSNCEICKLYVVDGREQRWRLKEKLALFLEADFEYNLVSRILENVDNVSLGHIHPLLP